MWGKVYKGGDIASVEIRSDEDRSAAGERKLRSFNYRIMMRTYEHVELEMKGRCSAG